MITTTYAGLTDVGRVRQENEDRWIADPELGLFLVADGIGGALGGGIASQAIVEVLPRLLHHRLAGSKRLEHSDLTIRQLIADALADVSDKLRNESSNVPGLRGMGTTVVLAFVRGAEAIVAHIGDSRAYWLHAGNLVRLTKDHSMAQVLLECGRIGLDDSQTHPARSQLTRYIGMPARPSPDTMLLRLNAGDRLLLCSDGLSNMLSDARLETILTEQPVPRNACKRLVRLANEAGGRDNITAIVIAVTEQLTP